MAVFVTSQTFEEKKMSSCTVIFLHDSTGSVSHPQKDGTSLRLETLTFLCSVDAWQQPVLILLRDRHILSIWIDVLPTAAVLISKAREPLKPLSPPLHVTLTHIYLGSFLFCYSHCTFSGENWTPPCMFYCLFSFHASSHAALDFTFSLDFSHLKSLGIKVLDCEDLTIKLNSVLFYYTHNGPNNQSIKKQGFLTATLKLQPTLIEKCSGHFFLEVRCHISSSFGGL